MQRWLAKQATRPKLLVVVAVTLIAYGIWGLAADDAFRHSLAEATALPLGIYLMACAIAGLREQRSASGD